MKNLSVYAEMLLNGEIYYKGTKTKVIPNECNLKGLSLELASKDFHGLPLDISSARGIDIVFTDENGKRRFMEVKSNGSPLAIAAERSSIMAYAFCVNLEKPLNKQWGYVLSRSAFMEIGEKLHHIVSGTTSGGRVHTLKTQTVWNNKKNAPHGAKAFKLEDEYIKAGARSFEEYFIERG